MVNESLLLENFLKMWPASSSKPWSWCRAVNHFNLSLSYYRFIYWFPCDVNTFPSPESVCNSPVLTSALPSWLRELELPLVLHWITVKAAEVIRCSCCHVFMCLSQAYMGSIQAEPGGHWEEKWEKMFPSGPEPGGCYGGVSRTNHCCHL